MIIIKVEVWRHGSPLNVKNIAEMKIWNDGTGTKTSGNYKATISKSNNKGQWKEGEAKGFPRLRLGIWDLTYRILHEILGQRNLITNGKT